MKRPSSSLIDAGMVRVTVPLSLAEYEALCILAKRLGRSPAQQARRIIALGDDYSSMDRITKDIRMVAEKRVEQRRGAGELL